MAASATSENQRAEFIAEAGRGESAKEDKIDSTFSQPIPLSAAQRESLFESHPIRTQSYIIPTIALENAYKLVRDRVWARRTGICFYGEPRVGKSIASHFIKSELEADFPSILVTRIEARASAQPRSNSHMPRLILAARRHATHTITKAEVLFSNAVSDTLMELNRKGGFLFVLIIDEMQWLSAHDLQQLLAIQNALAAERVRTIAISFAQPEILQRRSALNIANQKQLIARYLTEPIQFEACASCRELTLILHIYDVGSEFPDNSGISYTCFFLPQAFSQGFRLVSYVDLLWSSLKEAASHMEGQAIPMEHITMSIEHLLYMGYAEDKNNFALTKEDTDEAVRVSNLRLFGA